MSRPNQVSAKVEETVRLGDSPGIVRGFEAFTQTLLQFRGVTLHPLPEGDVIHGDAALGEQFLDVPVRQGETQVPPGWNKPRGGFKGAVAVGGARGLKPRVPVVETLAASALTPSCVCSSG
jgi:hypothetical protein